MMKNKKKILILLIIVIAAILITFFINKNGGSEEELEVVTTRADLKNCYITKTKSDISNGSDGLQDVKYLEFRKSADGQVEGFLNYLPAEKDSQRGNFVGIVDRDYLTIIYNSSQEGQNIIEQKIFKVYDDLIIESEPTEKVNVNGILQIKDLTSLAFGNDGIFSKVSCSEIDQEEAGL